MVFSPDASRDAQHHRSGRADEHTVITCVSDHRVVSGVVANVAGAFAAHARL